MKRKAHKPDFINGDCWATIIKDEPPKQKAMMTIEQIITLKQLLTQYRDDLRELELPYDASLCDKVLVLLNEEIRDHNR